MIAGKRSRKKAGSAVKSSRPIVEISSKKKSTSGGQNLPMEVKLSWKGRPSIKKNSMTVIRVGNRMLPQFSKSYKEALATQLPQIKEQWGERESIGSAENQLWLEAHFFISGKSEADWDNLVTSLFDLLQKAGVISNDRWIRSLDGTRKWWKWDKDNKRILEEDERTEVIIREYKG